VTLLARLAHRKHGMHTYMNPICMCTDGPNLGFQDKADSDGAGVGSHSSSLVDVSMTDSLIT
jgi:hypothetical protein